MKVKTLAGDSITGTIQKAHKLAQQHNQPVHFDFNGETIWVTPQDTPQALLEAWEDRRDAEVRAHRASAAYVRNQTERAERARFNQEEINVLLPQLDDALAGGPFRVLEWLRDFIPLGDHVDVLIPTTRLAQKLARLAPANTNVGRKDLLEPGNETDAALWVIGQAVSALEEGMPPHPMMGEWASRLLGKAP